MDIVLLAQDYSPLGVVERSEGDIELGGENDFRIMLNRVDYEPLLNVFKKYNPTATSLAGNMTNGARFAIVGTEFGGFIGKDVTDTANDSYELGGITLRGYLKRKIISPKPNNDYYIDSGDVRDIIYRLINGEGGTGSASPSFAEVIDLQNGSTGQAVTDYQFVRYTSVHDGIVKMLASVGYKMTLKYEVHEEIGAYGTRNIVKPKMYLNPIQDYSDQIVLSQNMKYNFQLSRQYDGINHLICLGKGELKDRMVRHLFVNSKGQISSTQSIFGADERVDVYDYSSAETEDILIEEGTKRLNTLINKESFGMSLVDESIDADIGDYIGGKDYLTGYFIKQPITKKIMFINKDGTWNIDYSIEGSEVEEDEH